MSSHDIIVPKMASTTMNTPQIFSPATLKYLKSIATKQIPLSGRQMQGYLRYISETYDVKKASKIQAGNVPLSSQASDLSSSVGQATSSASSSIDLKHFMEYMTSSEGKAMVDFTEMDLSYPISNYFINSSHNTYLTGNQLYSQSSTDAYKNVRVLPQFPTHWQWKLSVGLSLTSSDLPIIVSLEVHAGREQQEIMVEIIEQTWKGLLVKPLTHECQQLPSPGELRRKILIKVKFVAPEKVTAKTAKVAKPSMGRKKSSSSSSDSDNQGSQDTKSKKKHSSIIESLSALGVYTRSYHFKDLSSSEATAPCHVFSLSEKKLMDVHESHGPTLFSHNCNYMMRAFPSGTRVSSSNLDPAVFWRKGVQIVALNWQRCDAGMMLNEGMFAGSAGWVLKPEGYRGQRHGQTAEITDERQGKAIPHKTLSLSVDILAGQDLPLPIGDDRPDGFSPYVKCELHIEKPEERSGAAIEGGGKSKDGEHKFQTKTSRGVNPDFGGETVAFSNVLQVAEELSFVR
ncbi:MAG: hypothetical protein Q9222_006832 [Ikaeria aurantiellina]